MSLALGIDLGTSSIKVAIVDGVTCLAHATAPSSEMLITSPEPGWAEQEPDVWWKHVCEAVISLPSELRAQISSIGITYQMHGLVLVDQSHRSLRPAIIWCDSRAVAYGDRAFARLGADYCATHLLNSPGNFTASKLAWISDKEPSCYQQAKWALLPGDYLALRLTGEASTTQTGLSEMILWDFAKETLADAVLTAMDLNPNLFPPARTSFEGKETLSDSVATQLGLNPSATVTYRAGDQPNNAFALGVMQPGEVAANGGTSGVIYAITDQVSADESFRVNSFLHVNHTPDDKRIGVLMCLNGCGAMIRWLRDILFGAEAGYGGFDSGAERGSSGAVKVYPFGNGAERILSNSNPGASLVGLDFSRHSRQDLCRGAI
ncbi:MAG: FGGY family carbohydrate kinase, partial [Fimbriimonadaceae bacterium]